VSSTALATPSAVPASPSLSDRFDQKIFDAIYSRSLVYNTCWEDPAVDRQALELGPSDTVVVITSAGCNALDYALDEPRAIHAVDANPRQNALAQLKIAGIRALAHEDFFRLFGEGTHPRIREIYRDALRPQLTPFAQAWWDRHHRWFADPRQPLFFHGLSGLVARGFRRYLAMRPALREAVCAIFDTPDLQTQRALYDERIAPLLWTKPVDWMLSRQFTMSLLGVPFAQRRQVEAQHANGVAGFVRESIEYVFRELPARENYFWSVYVRGHYTPECCPQYLRPLPFARLKRGLVERIRLHTDTVTQFLRRTPARPTRFVLLDHMDWMSGYQPLALEEEWKEIERTAAPGARVLFRSAHRRPPYLDTLNVGGRPIRERLAFDDAWAERLTREDRVHTYAGFHIARFEG